MRNPLPLHWPLLLIILGLSPALLGADQKISINATINTQPVHLALDTGAQYSGLFQESAERLGLKYTSTGYKHGDSGSGTV
jgi:hypothetical protein